MATKDERLPAAAGLAATDLDVSEEHPQKLTNEDARRQSVG
jgi:hypothetical protein